MDRRHQPLEFDPKDLESIRRASAAAFVILTVFVAMAVFTPENRSVSSPVMVTATE